MTGRTIEEVNLALTELRLTIEMDERFDPLRQSGIKYVPGVGQMLSPKVMFIGEAPGPMENAKGSPFIGSAGKILRRLLTINNFQPEDIFITNVMKYMPCKPGGLNFRKPTQEEIDLAKPYIAREISAVWPDIICLMGNVPIRTFFVDETSVGKLRGKWIDLEEEGPLVFVTYHPSAVQYDQKKLPILERDFYQLAQKALS